MFFTLHRLLKRQLVSQSSTVGPDRSDRELSYTFKTYNDNVDVRRGKRKMDFMRGRTQSEIMAGRLWNKIEGPIPGGNQHMASEVSMDGAPLQVTCTLYTLYFLRLLPFCLQMRQWECMGLGIEESC